MKPSSEPPAGAPTTGHPVEIAQFERRQSSYQAAMERSEAFWQTRDEWLTTNGFVCTDGLPCWRGQVALEVAKRGTVTPAKLRAWLVRDGRCCNEGVA